MRNVIRSFLLLSFVVAIAVCAGCGQTGSAKNPADAGTRPLKTPDVTTKRPKIIAFGDSLTAGFGLSNKESYPYLLQEKLDADHFDYEVVNAGVSGDTSLGGLERSDWVLDQDNAKILILELGANDLLRGVPVSKVKNNLDQIIRKAKARNIKVLLCGMLAPPSVGSDYQHEFTMLFPDLADRHQVEFLPFLLENVALNKDLNQADGIHPNAAGERIMTDNIYKALKPML